MTRGVCVAGCAGPRRGAAGVKEAPGDRVRLMESRLVQDKDALDGCKPRPGNSLWRGSRRGPARGTVKCLEIRRLDESGA